MHRLGSLAAALAATLNVSVAAAQFNPTRSGHNTVFIHADGVGLAQWTIARAYWKGPDGQLNWDRLPQMAVYRGHLRDSLVASSNGGATTHAFGVKAGAGSFGRDAAGRRLTALSGYAGSLWREAAVRGHPVGLLNDGHLAEPGTAAFAAELDSRRDWNGAALQLLAGRDGASVGRSDDPLPHVLLGGGERNFLPQDAPRCLPGIQIAQQGIVTFPLDCMVHGLDWSRPERAAGPERTDGRNLLREAAAAGFVVIRTRAEFDATLARLQADRRWQPRILGLFAAHHLFNDRSEEDLLAAGFRRPDVDFRRPDLEPSGREARLVLFGSPAAGDPGFDPPRADEMLRLAMIVLGRVAQQGGRPYFLVAEAESTDNFAGVNNAVGMLQALRVADEMIGVALEEGAPRRGAPTPRFGTTILTAADSEAGSMQLVAVADATQAVGQLNVNAGQPAVGNPLDGQWGRGSAPFIAAPDARGQALPFAIAWSGPADVAGSVLARATTVGRRGRGLPSLADYSARFDNTDVYRFLYASLFAQRPDSMLPLPGR